MPEAIDNPEHFVILTKIFLNIGNLVAVMVKEKAHVPEGRAPIEHDVLSYQSRAYSRVVAT